MNIITKKVRLITAPVPFVGSTFRIHVKDDDLQWGIYSGTLAEGIDAVDIDWGDGEHDSYAGDDSIVHTYEHAGEYLVRMAEGVSILSVTGNRGFVDISAKKLLEFSITDRKMTTLTQFAFNGCCNLRRFSIAGSGVNILRRLVFQNCTSLKGRIDFPNVNNYILAESAKPLTGCIGGITEIHFDAAMAEVIGQSADFLKDPSLGTGTAVVSFDL